MTSLVWQHKKEKFMKVLMVEDEMKLAKAVKFLLKEQNINCETVSNGKVGFDMAFGNPYDVIILDVMLPGMNGFEILKELRKNGCSTPIIMLTAKNMVEDKVNGLNLGADDYLTKPFDSNELIARVKALSRRNGTKFASETLSYYDLVLDLSSSELKNGDETIKLNFKEMEIMKLLLMSQDKIVSKDILFDKVWGWESSATDSSIEAYMSFLRRKLKFLNSTVTIKNYQKIGYKLENSCDKEA